jgi:hypothetical protein
MMARKRAMMEQRRQRPALLPYTEKQRRYFHSKAEEGDPTFQKLAQEADSLPVKPPVKPGKHSKTRHPGSSKKLHKKSGY